MSEHYTNAYNDEEEFIKVVETEDSDFMEFPKEDDGSVRLRTIQTQFPNAIGIKYKGPSGAWRAIRDNGLTVDNGLVAPKDGWGDRVYCLTFAETKKRKVDSVGNDDSTASSGVSETKYAKTPINPLLRDLAVIGIPYETTNIDFKKYFEEKYGDVAQCTIKFDRDTGKSRGFGFIRFRDEEAAKNALNGEDYMDGRRIQVRQRKEKPIKMYVNGLPDGTTQEELIEHFSQFGTVIDSHIPKPFRSFAFFTFSSVEDGRSCLQQRHTFRDAQLKVRLRREKEDEPSAFEGRYGFGPAPGTSRGGFGNGGGRSGFGDGGGRGGFGNGGGRGGFGNGGGRGGFGDGGGRGGFGGRTGPPPFAGGYNPHGRNMPPPPPQGQSNPAAAEVKNMLLRFLTS